MTNLIKQGPVGELINRLYDLYLSGDIKALTCLVLDSDDMICNPSDYTTMSYPELIGSMTLSQSILDATQELVTDQPIDFYPDDLGD